VKKAHNATIIRLAPIIFKIRWFIVGILSPIPNETQDERPREWSGLASRDIDGEPGG